MKTFIVLSALAIIAAAVVTIELSPEQSNKLKEFYKECVSSTHVDTALVAKARKGEFTEDQKLKEFATCVFKAAKFIGDDGKINVENIKKQVPSAHQEQVGKIFAACAKVQDDPEKDRAYNAYKCYMSGSEVKFQLLPEVSA